MASLYGNTKDGWRITYYHDGKRKAFRFMGPKNTAQTLQRRVEELVLCREAGSAMTVDCARWLASVGEKTLDKLERVGLIEPEDRPQKKERKTLQQVVDAFLADHAGKDSTLTRKTQATDNMIERLDGSKMADRITPTDAEGFVRDMRKTYARATTARTVGYAKQVFQYAKRQGWVESNPFEEVKGGSTTNATRQHFVKRETIDRVIQSAPSAQWRLIIALSRYGGLRCPSEVLDLTWADIDFETGRMRVRSRKTEHHEGGAYRDVPLFAEVRGPLMDVFDMAEPGTERVITDYQPGANLFTHFRRIVKRAGVKPWPRLFHNMRATRQTELASEYPLATVCAWIGNTRAIAAGHYLQLTDADWQRATGCDSGNTGDTDSATQAATHTSSRISTEPHDESEVSETQGDMVNCAEPCGSVRKQKVGELGLEPRTSRV